MKIVKKNKLPLFIIFMAVLFVLSGFLVENASAQEDFSDPGMTPDSSFYFLDTLGEKISLFFTFNAEKKAEKALEFAEEKLAEAKAMAEENNAKALEKADEKYRDFLEMANKKSQEAKEQGKNVERITTLISERALKHQELLIDVLEKVPVEAREGIKNAIGASQKGFENAIDAVSGEKKEEMEKRFKETSARIKERFEALKEKLPEPINEDIEKVAPEEGREGASESSAGSPVASGESQEPKACIQVITPAIGPGNICKEFPTPCDIPADWKKVDKCPSVAVSPEPSKPTSLPEPTPTEIRYYTCPDGTKVESGKCYGTGETFRCAMKASPELQCPTPTPTSITTITPIPTTTSTLTPTSALTPTPATLVACCNTWGICKLVDTKETCLGMSFKPMSISSCSPNPCPAPAVVPQQYPEGKCTSGEVINYKCADGTSIKWCTCDDLGWDCPMYKYAERLCPATKETTLDTKAGQQIPATCVLGEALNTKCSDGRIFRSCLCEKLGDTGKTAWECGLEPICSQSGPPVVAGVGVSGAVTSDLPVELQTTTFGMVRITWMVSEPATSRLEYGTTISYGSMAGTDYFGSTYQGAELPNLQPDTTYHFRIRVRDKDIAPNTVVTGDYTFILRKLPELEIFPISVDHSNANTPNKIHVNIHNKGVIAAPKGFVVKVYVDDILVGEGPYDSDLASGASGEKIFDYTFPGNKTYAIKAMVDATNLVSELNEKNNEWQYSISIY